MIFQHTLDRVLNRSKTQTRRLWNPDWHVLYEDEADPFYIERIFRKPGHRLYYVGQERAVQPGRGKPAVARIRITRMWREDVRRISPSDLRAEGFMPALDREHHTISLAREKYVRLWKRMHGENYDALAIEFVRVS